MYDFANLLFAGPCNRACPFCIGHELPDRMNVDNLARWPLHGIDAFVDAVNRHRIREIVLTGTTSDPQLYRHEARLIEWLRAELHPGARLSVHTNGVLALKRIDVFNSYDRACISLPSFVPETYEKMMGSRRVPDLASILAASRIPVKVSAVINEHNAHEIDAFVKACWALGVRRLVVRRLFRETRRWNVLEDLPVVGEYRRNPVMDFRGMEVTYWDFSDSTSTSINLFPDGTLGSSYLLTETSKLIKTSAAAQRNLSVS